MATKLYFLSGAAGAIDYGTGTNNTKLDTTASAWQPLALSITAGSTLATSTTATVAGPTNGVEVAPTAATPRVWYSPPLNAAATISGSVTWNIWARESTTSANVAINGRLEVVDGATGTITLIDQTARTTELGASATVNTVQNFAETPAAGVACKRGDRLRVRIFGDDSTSNMGTALTFAIAVAGPTGGADGDSWVQLTENLTFVSEPAGSQVFLTDTASAVDVSASVATLLSSFTGSDENPLSEGGNWANINSSGSPLQRVGNQVASTTVSVGISYWTPTDFGPDVEAYATVATVGNDFGVWARVQGAGGANTHDGYLVIYVNSTSSVLIRRVTDVVATVLSTVAITALTNGAKLGIACHGNRIESWYQPSGGSWRLADAVTDSTYPSAGKVALQATASATVRVDDFYAGTASYTFGVPVEREAWTSRGGGVQTDVTNTVAGWTAPIQVTDTAGGTVVDWFTKPLVAFTLGGAVRCNIRALESNTLGNAVMRCEIARVAGDGTSPTVWGATTHGTLTALTTSEAAQSFLVSGDDLAVTNGQRLRIRLYIDDVSIAAMGASQTVTTQYAGAAAATGDTYVTFTQTLTEYAAAGNPPYVSPYPSLIAQ